MDEDQTPADVDVASLPRDTHDEFPSTGASLDDILDGTTAPTFEQAIASLSEDDGADETEDAADADESADDDTATEGESENDEDTSASEETTEGADEAETAAETRAAEARASVERQLLATFREAFPDVGAQTPSDLLAAFRQERQANDVVVNVLEREPAVAAFMRELAGGRSLAEAVRGAFAEQMRQPDRDDDPDGYDAWVRSETLREVREQQQRAELATAEDEAQRYADAARASIQSLAEANGWDAPTARRVGEQINAFIEAPPETYAAVIWRGLNHERLMADAEHAAATREASAELRGRNAAIGAARGKGAPAAGQGPKRFAAAGGAASAEPTGEHAAMAKRFKGGSDPLRALLG